MNNNKLMNVLQNLTSTLSRLTQASEAQTAALADLKEDLLLQDNMPDEEQNIDKQPDSGDITAVVNNCMLDSSKENVVSDGHSNLEAQSQNNIVESLAQAYQPNTKKSSAIEGKIAGPINTLLTGGLSANTANESAKKYTPPENIKFLSVSSVNEDVWDLLPWRSQTVDLVFQKVQEALLPGLSALCALSGKLIVSINSGKTPKTRETLTTIMDSVALLCHTHHKLNMKRRELIKPELNPPFTRLCKEEIKPSTKLFGDDLSKHGRGEKGRNTDAKIIQCYKLHIKPGL